MSSFFTINIYEPNGQGLLGTATRATRVYRKAALDAPDDIELSLLLTDPHTKTFDKGNYVEILAGRTTPQQVWARGYVQKVVRNPARTNEYLLTLAGAMIALSDMRDLGALLMGPPRFITILDALNGREYPAGSGQYPPGNKGLLTGTGWKAKWADSTPVPVIGGVLRTDWPVVLANVLQLAKSYNFHFREAPGSTPTSGVLECGQFGDDSGLIAWGGQPLLAYQQAHGYPGLTMANAALAQAAGLAVINSPSYSDDLSHVQNLVWGVGHGPAGSFVSLRSVFGDINTGQTYQPITGGRVYYLGPSYTINDLGRSETYTLVAAQQQDGNYAYGVMNVGSVNAFGVHEFTLVDRTIMDPQALLNACLGYADQYANPIPSLQIPVKHPRDSASAVPLTVRPGQHIDVRYAGQVAVIDT
ncbi:MAG: hypothetical protein ACRDFS_03520, partial [Chloroflexota bacterium]